MFYFIFKVVKYFVMLFCFVFKIVLYVNVYQKDLKVFVEDFEKVILKGFYFINMLISGINFFIK